MTNEELKKTVTLQGETLERLFGRVGQLVDELAMLRSEVGVFKNRVASDMSQVVKILQDK